MIQRITTLISYLLYRLINSMSSLVYLLAGFAFYWLTFFQRAPEPEYFILIIGFFGLLVSFFATLTVASKANEAKSYPFFVRLESRVEFLAAVMITALIFAMILQLLMAAVVLIRNAPELTVGRVLEIPPIWLSLNVFAAVIALQASDFVAYGWSRVWIFGLLALSIVIGDDNGATLTWVADLMRSNSQPGAANNAISSFSNVLLTVADFLTGSVMTSVSNLFSGLFWPFKAILAAVLDGYFTGPQALAPALLLVFASILFLLAADFFSSRDMILNED
ncbi:MAG: hypothetical protein AB8G95_19315 [Anaerolineae bacterium]